MLKRWRRWLQVTATKYGELAASILKIAAEQSEECAQLALERPLQCCAQWTPLDLIVRAQCDKVGCGGKAGWQLLTGSLLIYFNSHLQTSPQNAGLSGYLDPTCILSDLRRFTRPAQHQGDRSS
jgi:hypothetical protein